MCHVHVMRGVKGESLNLSTHYTYLLTQSSWITKLLLSCTHAMVVTIERKWYIMTSYDVIVH